MKLKLLLLLTLTFLFLPLTVANAQTTSFSNGDFESGSLQPWSTAGSVSISSAIYHSGLYSAYLKANGNNSGILQQTFAPVPVPFQFTFYVYTAQYPDACYHPYNQFMLLDVDGHALEGGFDNRGAAWVHDNQGGGDYSSNHGLPAYLANQWVRFDVYVTASSWNFTVNSQPISNNHTPFTFTDVTTLQFVTSCNGAMYLDDIYLGPQTPIPTPIPETPIQTLTLILSLTVALVLLKRRRT